MQKALRRSALLIQGPLGTGKTRLAGELIAALCKHEPEYKVTPVAFQDYSFEAVHNCSIAVQRKDLPVTVSIGSHKFGKAMLHLKNFGRWHKVHVLLALG